MKTWLIEHWNWLIKSTTMYGAALALAIPEIAEYLPTMREYIPDAMYATIFRLMVGYFVLTRIRAQLNFMKAVK